MTSLFRVTAANSNTTTRSPTSPPRRTGWPRCRTKCRPARRSAGRPTIPTAPCRPCSCRASSPATRSTRPTPTTRSPGSRPPTRPTRSRSACCSRPAPSSCRRSTPAPATPLGQRDRRPDQRPAQHAAQPGQHHLQRPAGLRRHDGGGCGLRRERQLRRRHRLGHPPDQLAVDRLGERGRHRRCSAPPARMRFTLLQQHRHDPADQPVLAEQLDAFADRRRDLDGERGPVAWRPPATSRCKPRRRPRRRPAPRCKTSCRASSSADMATRRDPAQQRQPQLPGRAADHREHSADVAAELPAVTKRGSYDEPTCQPPSASVALVHFVEPLPGFDDIDSYTLSAIDEGGLLYAMRSVRRSRAAVRAWPRPRPSSPTTARDRRRGRRRARAPTRSSCSSW